MNTSPRLDTLLYEPQDEAESANQKKVLSINKALESVQESHLNYVQWLSARKPLIGLLCVLITILVWSLIQLQFSSEKTEVGYAYCSAFLSLALGLCLFFCDKLRDNLLSDLKVLFKEISDKPYEIRMEWVKDDKNKPTQQIKVVVEANLLIAGNHVIKDKSQHVSAYIDSFESDQSIIKMIATLAKRAETQFK